MTECDLRPEGEMTIVAAAQLREHWLAWLTETAGADTDEWPEVGMDLRAVEAFDSAGVQLLLSLRRSLSARGQSLRLLSAPACVNDALERLGLHAALPAGEAPDEASEVTADAGAESGADGAPEAAA